MSGGSQPIRVPAELTGRALDLVVRTLFGWSWGQARGAIQTGKISVDGRVATDPRALVGAGSSIAFDVRAKRLRNEELVPDAIVHLDAHVVVVNKPSGVSTIPYDETETDTLDARVRHVLQRRGKAESRGTRAGPPPLGIVHRLDKETSGLIVFCRSWLAKQSLSGQFRKHTVERRYVAIAHGDVRSRTFRSRIVKNRGDGLRGSTRDPNQGQLAVTHVEALERLRGATLIGCRLETGRTHQIRIHLSESGHPIVGERVYIRGYAGEEIRAPRLMLHAETLGFEHPKTETHVRWQRPPPSDFEETLDRLRRA